MKCPNTICADDAIEECRKPQKELRWDLKTKHQMDFKKAI